MAPKRDIKRTGWCEVLGILLLAAGVLIFLSQISYHPADVSLLQSAPQRPAANFIGPAGACLAFGLFMALGVAAYLVPLVLGACGLFLVLGSELRVRFRSLWMVVVLVTMAVVFELQGDLWGRAAISLNLPSAGGMIGYFAGKRGLMQALGSLGTTIVCTAALLVSLVFLFDVRLAGLGRQMVAGLYRLLGTAGAAWDARRERQREIKKEEKILARQRKKLERSVHQQGLERKTPPSLGEVSEEPMFARTVEDEPGVKPEQIPPPSPAQDSVPVEVPPEPVDRDPIPLCEVEEAEPVTLSLGTELDGPHPTGAVAEDPSLVLPLEEGVPRVKVEYGLPPRELLHNAEENKGAGSGLDVTKSAQVLEDTLKDFGIACKVTNVERGPVVTRYEVLPAAGVRVERITGLSNNIALALKALSVRVQAPIPGKGVVGIEVPNSTKSEVVLSHLVDAPAWDSGRQALPLALGMDVGGRIIIADLADMPHILIAGATGAGKSVCINSILAGLLMSRTPDQMRLMLVDPKIVEFACYNGLPHLVVPVITDPKKVSIGLRWAINEMEKRYKFFAKVGVRNIWDFNHRPLVEQTELFGEVQSAHDKVAGVPDALPYIAIVIDELADLMLVAQADVESGIARLAQLSRAVGIHMIIATQRPSVNVITGTIKANFPARIAFQVAQKVDSRTILDASGAELLLGKGDMMFLSPGGSKPTRAQGAFVADEEVQAIVEHWTSQAEPEFVVEIQEKIGEKTAEQGDGEEEDELLDSAVEIIRQTHRASTSSLQRRLRIGYTRAARLMDILEEKGMIGPPRGSEPREILIDLDDEIPQNPTTSADTSAV